MLHGSLNFQCEVLTWVYSSEAQLFSKKQKSSFQSLWVPALCRDIIFISLTWVHPRSHLMLFRDVKIETALAFSGSVLSFELSFHWGHLMLPLLACSVAMDSLWAFPSPDLKYLCVFIEWGLGAAHRPGRACSQTSSLFTLQYPGTWIQMQHSAQVAADQRHPWTPWHWLSRPRLIFTGSASNGIPQGGSHALE